MTHQTRTEPVCENCGVALRPIDLDTQCFSCWNVDHVFGCVDADVLRKIARRNGWEITQQVTTDDREALGA